MHRFVVECIHKWFFAHTERLRFLERFRLDWFKHRCKCLSSGLLVYGGMN
jgi:hypothetical protein